MADSIDSDKYNLLYGKILSIVDNPDSAKQLANVLYQIGSTLGLSNDELTKYVSVNGLQFNNQVYTQLNASRTNSSQIGFIDENNIPPSISQQVV